MNYLTKANDKAQSTAGSTYALLAIAEILKEILKEIRRSNEGFENAGTKTNRSKS